MAVTFLAGKGDVDAGRPADDLVFVVSEKPHDTFTRKGNDLQTNVTIPLATALAGGTTQVGVATAGALSGDLCACM